MKRLAFLIAFFSPFLLCGQNGYFSWDNRVYGYWDASENVQYFFGPNGAGALFVKATADSTESYDFSWSGDTINGITRVHVNFYDSTLTGLCFIYEGGGELLVVYSMDDVRMCPESKTDAGIKKTYWIRNLGGK